MKKNSWDERKESEKREEPNIRRDGKNRILVWCWVQIERAYMVTANQDGGMEKAWVCCSLQLESSEGWPERAKVKDRRTEFHFVFYNLMTREKDQRLHLIQPWPCNLKLFAIRATKNEHGNCLWVCALYRHMHVLRLNNCAVYMYTSDRLHTTWCTQLVSLCNAQIHHNVTTLQLQMLLLQGLLLLYKIIMYYYLST